MRVQLNLLDLLMLLPTDITLLHHTNPASITCWIMMMMMMMVVMMTMMATTIYSSSQFSEGILYRHAPALLAPSAGVPVYNM